jgi:integrase
VTDDGRRPDQYERPKAKLTDAMVKNYKPLSDRRRVIYDHGAESLYLVVAPTGRKSWLMRFRRPDGRIGKIVLGRLDNSGHELEGDPEIGEALSLKGARALANKVHRERRRRDVVADYKAQKHRLRAAIAEGQANAFAHQVKKFIAEHARAKNRHWDKTARVLGLEYGEADDGPTVIKGSLADRWGEKDVRAIDAHDCFAAIDEARRHAIPGLERRNAHLSEARARSVAAALSKLFGWLVEHRRVATNPVAGLKVEASRKRDRVLTDAEVVKFWGAVSALRAELGAPLKLLLLTGQRLSEVTGMRRNELSADSATWSIPGSRTKNKKPHVVPLAPAVRDLIASLPRIEGDLVFTTTGTAPVNLGSKIKHQLDRTMGNPPPWRLHDLRRTAVTGMAELGVEPHVIELVVNHLSGTRGGVAGIYNRSEMMAERRAALERWAAHVHGLVTGAKAKVVTLKRSVP